MLLRLRKKLLGKTTNPKVDDLMIASLVIGSHGADTNGQPRKIDPKRTNLYSESNWVKGPNKDRWHAYLWESSWDTYSIPQNGNVVLVKEGSNYDHLGKETAAAYMGTPTPTNKEIGSVIKATYNKGVMTYEFEIKKLSGTGAHSFSEAALYMKRGRNINHLEPQWEPFLV